MPWGTCDDGFYDHDKVVGIPLEVRNAACGLYWRAISYCNAKLTDGHLSEPVVRSILDGTPDQIEALLAARLWHRRKHGYVVHDFLEGGYNKSRAQVEAERQAKAEAGRLGGLRSGQTRREKANRPSKTTPNQPNQKSASAPSSDVPNSAGKAAPRPGPSTKPPKQTRSTREAGASRSLELRIPSESPGVNEGESQAPTAVPARETTGASHRNGKVRQLDPGLTLSAAELEQWAGFTRDEWAPFKAAWLARGFRLPPSGDAGDDGAESQRAVLWSIARDVPAKLAKWVSEAPGRTPRAVVDHVLRCWHELQDEAGTQAADHEFEWFDAKRADAESAGAILGRLSGGQAEP